MGRLRLCRSLLDMVQLQWHIIQNKEMVLLQVSQVLYVRLSRQTGLQYFIMSPSASLGWACWNAILSAGSLC